MVKLLSALRTWHSFAVAFLHWTLVYLPLEFGTAKCFGNGES